MNQFESEMLSVLKILSDSHTLENCIISGSWATYFYEKIFNGFIPRIKTTDLDVYLPEPKRIKPSDFCEKMRLNLFLKKEDVLTGKSSFVSGDFTVEFLTTPDRTLSNVIKVKGLSIGAEALPKMSLIGWNYVNVDYNGITVKVASPVSFVLQKLLINKERTPESKKEKDIEAAKYVLSYVLCSRKYKDELIDSLYKMPRKWKKDILDTAKSNEINLFSL